MAESNKPRKDAAPAIATEPRRPVADLAAEAGTPAHVLAAAAAHADWPFEAVSGRLVQCATKTDFDAAVAASLTIRLR